MDWTSVYGVVTIASGLICAATALYLAPHWRHKSAGLLMLLMGALATWIIGYGMEFLSPTLELKLWWVRLEYLGTPWIGILLFRFSRSVSGRPIKRCLGPWRYLLLFPPVVLGLVLTNDLHHLMWTGVRIQIQGPVHCLVFDRGPAFWVYVYITYALMLLAVFITIRELRFPRRIHRSQLFLLLTGILTPWAGNILYLFHLDRLGYLDISPFTFMLSGLIFAVGLIRFRFLNLIPLAHQVLMDSMTDPVVVLDMQDRIIAVNTAFANQFHQGHPVSQGTQPLEEIAPELLAHATAQEAYTPPTGPVHIRSRYWDLRVSPLTSSTGRPIGRLLTLRDITDQKQHQEYISGIINAMPSLLVGVTRTGTLTQWNHRAEALTGLSREKVEGRHLAKVLPELWERIPDLATAMAGNQIRSWEKIHIPLNRIQITARITLYPISVENQAMGQVIRVDDISDQVRMEEMIVHSEKMMSIGGLAAGMAHEINNPLAGILQNLQVIQNRLAHPLPANETCARACGFGMTDLARYMEKRQITRLIHRAQEGGGRISRIIDNMLSFARKSPDRPAPQDLKKLVAATLDLVRKDYSICRHLDMESLQFVWDVEPEPLPWVPCRESKIQQVVFNILKNGIQAMDQARTPNPCFHLGLSTLPGEIQLRIRNNGPAIPAQIRKRIFEPFFTTKPQGVGTGLGLSVSYFIVTQDHGGRLLVDCPPQGGTCFTLGLPITVTPSTRN